MKKLLLIVVLALTVQTIKAQTVDIGNQTWTTKNLDVTTYSDGTAIPQVTDPTKWGNLTTGAWCYYNNDPANGTTYGKLYNWYAVSGIWNESSKTDVSQRKKLAPTGYHIPSDNEWTILTDYLGGESVAGAKMKEVGNVHWSMSNTSATNSSGFTALPGGFRSDSSDSGAFFYNTLIGYFWTTSFYINDYNTTNVWTRDLFYNYNFAYRTATPVLTYGFSVRCIKDIALNVKSFNENSINIFPNPAKDQITINCVNLTNISGWNYKIINTLGQEVMNGKINLQLNIINLNGLKSKGIYFVKIYDNLNILIDNKKIIIE